ncbi:Presenilin-1 [Mortierella alpina]|nr:Presenilin-1 [Mortierella alpina]
MSSPAPRGATGPSGLPSSTSSPSPTAARDNAAANTPQRANASPGQTANADDGPGPGLDDGEDQPCQSCGEFPARFQCSACQSVRYCSQECQASDWRIHFRECAEIVAALKEEQQEAEYGRVQSGEGAVVDRDSNRVDQGRLSEGSRTITNGPLGEEAENVRATANRPRRRPREPRRRPQLTPEQRAAYEEAERIADMKFYMLQIYKIIKPVVVCIVLSIVWVKISLGGSDYRPTQSSYTVYKETPTSTVSQNILGSLANAGIIIGQIVIVTIIIVVLFKRGHIKILIGFFMVVVAMLLGFMGYILVLNLIQVMRIPLDYVTMVFALWNFSVVGLISVFWKGPMWLQQVYLTVMSSLMAFSLTGLAEWTTWMLLALLVVWDLIAVLCPFGPLKILVESSRNQNQEVPALLYTVNAVWFMASPPNAILNRDANATKEAIDSEELRLEDDFHNRSAFNGGHSRATGRDGGASISSSRNSDLEPSFHITGNMSGRSSTVALVPGPSNVSMEDRDNIEMRERSSPRGRQGEGTAIRQGEGAGGRHMSTRQGRSSERGRSVDGDTQHGDEDDEDDDGGGLKLGLGDFVFYSVLIARAAMFDWVTTICCTVAVLTGMNATIFLLAIYQKALPALPISICFGMLFYFATRFALVPFLAVLGPSQVFI